MIGPQAGAAAGGVESVGLELLAVVVRTREQHVGNAEAVICGVWLGILRHLNTKIAFD